MAVSKVKAIRMICKRVTATPYKKQITLLKINYDTKYKKNIYVSIYVKEKLPVAVTLLKKKYKLIYNIYTSIKIS